MPLNIEPLHPLFAARITGLDMTRPLTSGEVAEVHGLMDRFAVCVFPNPTPLGNDQHIAFARHLGPMQRGRVLTVTGRRERLEDWPELVDVGNLDVDGNIRSADSRARAFMRLDAARAASALAIQLTDLADSIEAQASALECGSSLQSPWSTH